MPTCIDGESFGIFDYTLTLKGEEKCPADATCTTPEIIAGSLPFAVIDCAKFSTGACETNELRSSIDPTPGTHQGKVRCRTFYLEESYCLPPEAAP